MTDAERSRSRSTATVPRGAPPSVASRCAAAQEESRPQLAVRSGALLTDFLSGVDEPTLDERTEIADAALRLLSDVFVHLNLKRSMHAIEPIQRLRLLQRRLGRERTGELPERSALAFHAEMISIFHSLRDLHTNYVLPSSYQGWTAYLPFLVQACTEGPQKKREFVVTRVVASAVPAAFRRGVQITAWNGISIERAVELNAEREAGSNEAARFARGLESLTLRPLALSAPPDESWVVVEYTAGGQSLEARFDWVVAMNPPPLAGVDVDTTGSIDHLGEAAYQLGFDTEGVVRTRAKKAIFFPDQIRAEQQMAHVMSDAAAESADSHQRGSPSRSRGYMCGTADAATTRVAVAAQNLPGDVPVGNAPMVSLLPDVFACRLVRTQHGEYGYIRIFTFMVQDPNVFIAEFVRLASLLPQTGLILDVRGNGGGNIVAGELLLQVLTDRTIEPERFHFANTDAAFQLCQAVATLEPWSESIGLSLESGEPYSQGYYLTDQQSANALGRRYPGDTVLLVDSLCYSTTDIFAAGFQDHEIGPILGTDSRTGGGGANVWTYGVLRPLLGYPMLPKGVTFRSAVRRCTRVGSKTGFPVEDFGVAVDHVHSLSRRDILDGNLDLFDAAGALLQQLAEARRPLNRAK